MEFLYDYGLFLAKAVTIAAALVFVLGFVFAISHRQRPEADGHIEIRSLNEHYQGMNDAMREVLEDHDTVKSDCKERDKSEKKQRKEQKKQRKAGLKPAHKPRMFVLSFDGDIKASEAEHLREEVSAVLLQAEEDDSVLLKLESPGGLVHGYGYAASQLQRLVDAKVNLVVAVDKVAASGGYMMACVANKIIAAPFAVLGSIGVVAQIPNFHRVLKDNKVDFEVLTAGEYKRTMTVFGENTERDRAKFIEDLEDTHELFKNHVSKHRPGVNIAEVATGETWYGSQALENGLIDAVQTSDGYIQDRIHEQLVYSVKWKHKKTWQERLGFAAEGALTRSFLRLWQHSQNGRHF
ncbi:MAG: protease SohB [Gammaproteobacteria bacterium]|nr:MAG: protease SohB [Gammaproteobacteria bacterium]